jgi:oxygen-independent coproporphyrinogen-3 oxidase
MSEAKYPGLYVHVPFCLSKCPYCDFYSITGLDLIPTWLQALEEECRLRAGSFGVFDSLFIGGGTPSILTAHQLERLMAGLHRHFTFHERSELTIEVNPDDVSREKLELFHRQGFNRISLGVQSIHEEELRFLGRRHTARQTLGALEMVRSGGFKCVSLDLIYGFSGSRAYSHRDLWEDTLQKTLGFHPDHLSCYMMTIEGDTPFRRLLSKGRLKTLPDHELEKLFLFTAELLEENGFAQYEISNFARSPRAVCRHNWKYWDHTPYLGLGPSAHSFLDGARWWNGRSVRRYCEALQRGQLPVEGREELTAEQLHLESVFLGLRTNQGVQRTLLANQPGAASALDRLVNEGIVEVRHGRVIPTRKGFLLADGLPLLF